jgi:hypothetical protein
MIMSERIAAVLNAHERGEIEIKPSDLRVIYRLQQVAAGKVFGSDQRVGETLERAA